MDENGDGVVRLDELREQQKKEDESSSIFAKYQSDQKAILEKAAKDNNYWDALETEYDRIKADTDGDGKISKAEYNKFIVYKEELKILPPDNVNNNIYNTQHTYRLDFSFYIVIGMLCITAIVIKLLQRK